MADGRRGDLVVLPGLCVSSYLRPACDALSLAGFDVRLAVPPGWPQGGSYDEEPRTLADVARPVATWLAAEGLRDVVLVGQSVGAPLAVHVALQEPGRVARIILQGPVFDPAQRAVGPALLHWVSDVPGERPSLLAIEGPEWLRVGPRRIWRTLRMALDEPLERTLDGLPSPGPVVDVVVGGRDPLSTRAWTMSLVRGGGSHVVLGTLPHSSPHANPQAFAEVVVALTDGSRVG